MFMLKDVGLLIKVLVGLFLGMKWMRFMDS